MKKIIMIIACLMLGGAIFAQSKGELKEQIDALTAELQTLRNDLTNSLQRNRQLESRIIELENMLTSQDNTIATQKTTIANYNEQLAGYAEQLNSYAQQVARLNNEITSLTNLVISDTARRTPTATTTVTSPRERVFIFTNANATFKVPAGKIWKISGCGPTALSFNSYESLHKERSDQNWRGLSLFYSKIGNKVINVPNYAKDLYNHTCGAGTQRYINENTEFKLEIWFIKDIERNGDDYEAKDRLAPNDFQYYLRIEELDIE
ncbi:MAG: hypothetical protein J5848_07070 [Bacteroidales bacterium]|nr:hypothetical protein [Bacteroidales bacterium]